MIHDDLSRLEHEPPAADVDQSRPGVGGGEAEPPDDGTDRQPSKGWLGPRRLGRWRLWRRLSIQSQLLTMLLVVSVASVLVAGTIGYFKGRDSLRDAAFAELTAVREARARELTRFYESTLNALVIYTRGETATAAAEAFHRGLRRARRQHGDAGPER